MQRMKRRMTAGATVIGLAGVLALAVPAAAQDVLVFTSCGETVTVAGETVLADAKADEPARLGEIR